MSKKTPTPPAAPADDEQPGEPADAPNHRALDSLDAAADAMGLSDGQGDTPAPTPRRAKGGRPTGARGKGPSKDEWRGRARAAEAKLRATEATTVAVQVENGANALRGPLDLTVRYWFGRQAAEHGRHWLLRDDEADALSGAWAAALAPWAPALAQYAPIGVALTVSIQLIRERQKIDHAGGSPPIGPRIVHSDDRGSWEEPTPPGPKSPNVVYVKEPAAAAPSPADTVTIEKGAE